MFRRWIYKLVMQAWDDHDKFKDDRRSVGHVNRIRSRMFDEVISTDTGPELHSNRMKFSLYKCVGGHVIETSVYNSREDETQHTLYMIKEEEDFAQQVAHAIMLEMMKQ